MRTTPLLALAALTLTAGCSNAGTTTSSPSTTTSTSTSTTTSVAASPSTTTPSTTPSTTSSATSSATSGAPSTGASAVQIPAGAGTATTVDLDGDGKPDTLWLADSGGKRELGVTTTSHGTSVVEFTSAAPQSATASAAVLASGAPTVFLNTGRSVQLYVYRVENPGLVEVKGVTGQPYSFSLGFTDYGTGLTCTDGRLYGENATADSSNRFTVTRTEVTVSAEHAVAQNGAKTTVGTGLASDDPAVQAAHGTTCGDVPDSAVAKEPM